jgi:hypothetical protein
LIQESNFDHTSNANSNLDLMHRDQKFNRSIIFFPLLHIDGTNFFLPFGQNH